MNQNKTPIEANSPSFQGVGRTCAAHKSDHALQVNLAMLPDHSDRALNGCIQYFILARGFQS